MDIPVIYEDEALVVVSKPVGLVCNRASTVMQETLQDWMRREKLGIRRIGEEAGNELERYFEERDGLVHRLDKETSGVMVLAKTPVAFGELLRQFKEREVKKEYLALTHGRWKVKEGEIRMPVGRMRHNRQMMGVREDGRESVTRYQVEREWEKGEFPKELGVNEKGYGGFSLVRFLPRTGRMHQIRVHAKQLGHALVGDLLYAGRKRSREDRKWCKGLMLRAIGIEFTHPTTKQRVRYESQWVEVEAVLKYLC